MALTLLCIATYRKGDEFLRECRRQGCRVLLLTDESLRDADWPREAIDAFYFTRRDMPESDILDHCRVIAEIIPVFGFYLQPAVGGRILSYNFWREFAEISNVWAIKIAPFNRYQTIDVIRAVVEAGRDDIALYTGNDDNIVPDLLTPFPVQVGGTTVLRWIDGGLLGQWAVWTRAAVGLLAGVKEARVTGEYAPSLLSYGAALTDANAAVFDAANGFRGCIPGIHEVLRRQGLLDGVWCLDPDEVLSPGQADEITRVERAYPEVTDSDYEL